MIGSNRKILNYRWFLQGVLITVTIWSLVACASMRITREDSAWWMKQDESIYNYQCSYEGMNLSSQYLTMRDGVQLAIDIYLPEGLEEGRKIPTILMQTRYARALEYRWPFGFFLGGRYDDTIEYFVTRGYAWVYVDVRGSGASYGTRSFPYSHEEIKDGAEIADWITNQPWSNGLIGACGNSYEGTSAVLLLTNNHPAVKAVMPRYAMFDLYTDAIFPGGIQLTWFTETWSSLCRAMDKNRVEEFAGFKAKIAVKGIRPVDNDSDRTIPEDIVTEHATNLYITDLISDITFRDDTSSQYQGITIDHISPHERLDEINRSDAAIYLYTGWYDASCVLSAIKYFTYLKNSEKKLTIGPWDHGGWHNISPTAEGDRSYFNSDAEMLRFFDYHLKGIDTGIYREESVHYFTMREDKWKSSSTWPPQGTKKVFYFLAGHNALVLTAPESSSGFDLYEVDYTAGSGNSSRWNSLVNLSHKPIIYPDRCEEDYKHLCYTTSPLREDMEVTGHPEVGLYVSSTAEDGNFFIYLEDIDPKGRVTYVTEEMLRMLHSKRCDSTSQHDTLTPCRTYKREDAFVLGSEEVAELVFSLFPISYLFKKNHSIRISLAGADKDHFVFNPKEPPIVSIYRNCNNPSYIALPVVKNDQ